MQMHFYLSAKGVLKYGTRRNGSWKNVLYRCSIVFGILPVNFTDMLRLFSHKKWSTMQWKL